MERRWGRVSLALATTVAMIALGCSAATPAPTPTPPPSPTKSAAPPTASPTTHTLEPSAKIVKVFDEVPAGCAIADAYAGRSPIPPLPNCASPISNWMPIPAGSLVTTSTCGEAWLDTDCGSLYVFGGSDVQVSTCDPSSPATGSACVQSGSAAWYGDDCADEVAIATPAGTIRLQGTWISATYIPERQLALFAVFDGVGEATPVVDMANLVVDQPTTVQPGFFWFTTPGDAPAEVAGLPAREAIPFDRLPDIVRELHLDSAFAAIRRQAAADRISVAAVPEMPVITVRLGGPGFDNPDAREGVLLAFDWRRIAVATLGRDDAAVVALAGDELPRDLSAIERDTDKAGALVDQGKLRSALVTWDPDPRLDEFAIVYMSALESMQFEEFVYFDATDARASPGETAAGIYGANSRDAPVIWLDLQE